MATKKIFPCGSIRKRQATFMPHPGAEPWGLHSAGHLDLGVTVRGGFGDPLIRQQLEVLAIFLEEAQHRGLAHNRALEGRLKGAIFEEQLNQ